MDGFRKHFWHGSSGAGVTTGLLSRLGKGVVVSILTLGLSCACNFFMVPVILGHWGAGGYGLWVTLFAAVAYLSLLDLGGQNFVQNLLAMTYARNDAGRFRSTLSQGFALYLWLGAVGCVVWAALLLIGRSLPMPLLGRPLRSVEYSVLGWLGAMQFLLAVPFGVFVTSYRATGHYSRGMLLGSVTKALLFVASIAVVWRGGGPKALALTYFTVSVFSAIILMLDARRVIPEAFPLNIWWRSARSGLALLKGSFFNWLLAISNLMNQQVPLLILASLGNTQQVAQYATHRMIANLVGYMPSIIVGPVMPEFTFLWSLNIGREFRELVVRTVVAVTSAAGMAALALFFAAPMFYARWTAGHISYQWSLSALLLAEGVTSAVTTTVGWALIATNRHRAFAVGSILYSTILLIGAVPIIPRFGARGIVVEAMILDVLFFLAVTYIIARQLQPVLASDLIRAVVKTMAFLSAFAALDGLVARWLPEKWSAAGTAGLAIVQATIVVYVISRRWKLQRLVPLRSAWK